MTPISVNENLVAMTQETIETIEREEREAVAEKRKLWILEKGEYRAVLSMWEKRDPAQAGNLFNGHDVYRTDWTVEVAGGGTQWLNYVDACPALVRYDDNRISLPTLLARDLYRVTNLPAGQASMEAVLNAATGVPVTLTVTRKKDGTKNYITKVRV